MADELQKFKLKGHESFYIREGWLVKGIKNIKREPKVFLEKDATEVLGLGTNMVKALRYWLQATTITEEIKVQGNKREQYLSKNFGEVLYKCDPYFEDIFSLWLVHYKIATNKSLSTSWYLFFNEVNSLEFTKDDLKKEMTHALNRLTNNAEFSENSLFDDCECILKTYFDDKKEDRNPEDNIVCPLSELDLVSKHSMEKGKELIQKKKPSIDKLDKLVVLYIIVDNLNDSYNTSIDEILYGKCNAGKVLNQIGRAHV